MLRNTHHTHTPHAQYDCTKMDREGKPATKHNEGIMCVTGLDLAGKLQNTDGSNNERCKSFSTSFLGLPDLVLNPLPHVDKIRRRRLLRGLGRDARSKLSLQQCNMWQGLPGSDGVFRLSFSSMFKEMCVWQSHH